MWYIFPLEGGAGGMLEQRERFSDCVEHLLRHKTCVYAAASMDELTDVLEEVSLQLEERAQDFSFSIDGVTVTFQLQES
jgi:hypothetical protein